MKRGRPKKSLAEIQRDETYRKDRHADRLDEANWVTGAPVKPKDLNDHQSRVWDYVVDSLPEGSIGLIDTPMLEGLMHWIEIAEVSREAVKAFEPVGEVDNRGRAVRTYKLCWQEVDKILSSFGVTPRNRGLVKEFVSVETEDPLCPIKFMQGDL